MRMIGIPKNFIGARPGRVYSWGGSASIQTASGTVVTFPQSAERAFSGLSIYGHSTQSGTPSPENPVPIVSAGSVMTTGAQLFDIEEANNFNTQGGYTVSIDGQKIHVVGNNVEYSTVRLFSYRLTLPAGTYTMSIDHPVPCQIRFDNFISILANQLSRTATFEESVDITHLAINTEIGASFDFEFTLMLNSGSTALPWEPYTGGIPGVNPYAGEINVSVSDGGTQSQTLTLSTPGGLPGIPVDSGGNYTDADGQQWICDEIDLARGKLIKRVGKTVVDGADIKFKADSAGSFWNLPRYSSPGIKYDASIQSTYFPFTVFNENKPYEFIWTSPNLMSSYFSTVNELNQFCTEMNDMGQPVTLYYTLDTPIETDLTAEEIAAYKALHTYSPTTTVSNDANAWMKVEYKG